MTIYYGLADAGQVAGDWNQSLSLGSKDQGAFDVLLQGLDSGKTYYYRFLADNSPTTWSNVGSFTTLRFDQGILRINTGLDDLGAIREYSGIVTMGKERKNYSMLIFQQQVIWHLTVLPGKCPRQHLRFQKIYFSVKTWRILYWKVQMLFRWMWMGILRLQRI